MQFSEDASNFICAAVLLQVRQQVEAVSLGPQVREGEVRSHVVAGILLQSSSLDRSSNCGAGSCEAVSTMPWVQAGGFFQQLPGSFVYEAKRSSSEQRSPNLTCNVLLLRSGRRAMSTSMNTLEISNLGSHDLSICVCRVHRTDF